MCFARRSAQPAPRQPKLRFSSNSSLCLSPTPATLPCCWTAGATLPHCSELTALLGFEYISGGRGGEGSRDQRPQAQHLPHLQGVLLKPWGPPPLSSGSLTVHIEKLKLTEMVFATAPRSAPRPGVCTAPLKALAGSLLLPASWWCCTTSLHSNPAPGGPHTVGALPLLSLPSCCLLIIHGVSETTSIREASKNTPGTVLILSVSVQTQPHRLPHLLRCTKVPTIWYF